MKKLWTYRDRRIIYDTLVEEFGPLNTWPKKTTPGNTKEFKIILNNLSNTLHAGPNAILQQIKFIFSWNKKYDKSGYMSAWIKNVAAALDAGFLFNKDLPETITTNNGENNDLTI